MLTARGAAHKIFDRSSAKTSLARIWCRLPVKHRPPWIAPDARDVRGSWNRVGRDTAEDPHEEMTESAVLHAGAWTHGNVKLQVDRVTVKPETEHPRCLPLIKVLRYRPKWLLFLKLFKLPCQKGYHSCVRVQCSERTRILL